MPMRAFLALALLVAGCGAQPRGVVAAGQDAQTVHTDGLLGGFAGRVASHEGKLVLALVHQAAFHPTVLCGAIAVLGPGGRLETPLYLGADHQLHGELAPGKFTALGAYVGTPTPGQPLRYQLLAGAHLSFEAAHADALTGAAMPAVTTFARTPLPGVEETAPGFLPTP